MSEAPAPPPLSATEARILGSLIEKRETRWIEVLLSRMGRVLQIRIRPVNQGLLGARKLRRIRALSASHLGADVRPRAAQLDVSDWLRSEKIAHSSQFEAALETQSRIRMSSFVLWRISLRAGRPESLRGL